MPNHLTAKKIINFTQQKPWYFFWIAGSCLIATIHWANVYYRYDTPKWWLLDIFFAVFVGTKIIVTPRITVSAYALLSGAFVLWCLLTTLWSSNPYASVELTLRYALIAACIYFLIADIRDNGYPLLLPVCAISSCCVFFVVLALERYVLRIPFENASYTPLGFINHAGHVYVIWLPILLLGMFELGKTGKILCAALLACCLLVLVDSAIRASIAGLGSACIVLAILLYKKDRLNALRCLLLLGLLILSIFSLSWVQKDDAAINAKITRIAQAPDLNYASSDRILMFKNTLDMIVDNPFGVGLNNFEYMHPLYGKAGTAEASPFMNEAQILRQPHNFYLKNLSETGWLGGGLISLLIIGLLLPALKRQNSTNPWRAAYTLGILATFANALFCAVFSNPASLWFFSLVVASFISSMPERKNIYIFDLASSKKLLLVACLVGAAGLSTTNLISQQLALSGLLTQNTVKLQRAVDIYPGNERAWFDLATTLFDQDGNPLEAISAMQNFLRIYPYHIGARYKLTQWYCFQRDYAHCKSEALHLLSYYPTFKPVQQLYFQANENLNKSAR